MSMILLIPCVICALSALSFLPDYNSMCCPTHPGRLADSPQSLNPWTPCVCLGVLQVLVTQP